jgi:hypothetical protein
VQPAIEAVPDAPAGHTWSLQDRVSYGLTSVVFPGVGQFQQGRYWPAFLHGGGAVLLGLTGTLGWLGDARGLLVVGTIGMGALSAYSAYDAFTARSPAELR